MVFSLLVYYLYTIMILIVAIKNFKSDNMLLKSINQIEQLYNHTEKLVLKVTDLKEQMIYGIN